MQLEWTPDLSFGHDKIDQQHQALFKAFEELGKGCARGEAKAMLFNLFNYLQDYINEHFRDEEALMKACGFPGLAQHRREHQSFCERIAQIRNDLEKGDAMLSVVIQTNKALVSWLIHHIRERDQQLGRFLKENGYL